MLRSDMREREKKEMIIDDIDSETMQEFVNFLYTGKVKCIENVVNSLLYAAEKYEVLELKYVCLTYIKQNLSEDNVWEILLIAHMCSEERLLIECIGLIYM
jgi:Zn-finger domain-containing protein